MATINELIEFHNENEYLDFKQEEYKDQKKHELIKDVLAFANAEYAGDRYIIIGIKKTNGEPEAFQVESPLDSSDIQTYVLEYIKPDLKIDYFSHQYNGANTMILRINNPADQPYAMKKSLSYFNGTKTYLVDSMKIRKGSRTFDMTREDLERIYAGKYNRKNYFLDKLELIFENGTKSLELKSTADLSPPSQVEAASISERIKYMERLLSSNPSEYSNQTSYNSYRHHNSLSGLGLPELRTRLDHIGSNKVAEDHYFYTEQTAHKIQLLIKNQSNESLKNAFVVIQIPEQVGLHVESKIERNPKFEVQIATYEQLNYPGVEKTAGVTTITQQVGNVQHQYRTEVFKSKLRIWAEKALIGQCIEAKVIIHAENLPEPVSSHLQIAVIN